MENIFVSESNRVNCFPDLFGKELFKGLPLYFYAENLFYAGMSQMVDVYNGGYFEYLKLDDKGISFVPVINSDEQVTINTPFSHGVLSYRSACLVVWLFVLEQIANNCNSSKYQRRVIDCYSQAAAQYRYFDIFKEDLNVIHHLID